MHQGGFAKPYGTDYLILRNFLTAKIPTRPKLE